MSIKQAVGKIRGKCRPYEQTLWQSRWIRVCFEHGGSSRDVGNGSIAEIQYKRMFWAVHSGSWLWFQHLGVGDRRIAMSLRPVWVTEWAQATWTTVSLRKQGGGRENWRAGSVVNNMYVLIENQFVPSMPDNSQSAVALAQGIWRPLPSSTGTCAHKWAPTLTHTHNYN